MPCTLFPPSLAEDSSWVAQIYKGACFRRNPHQNCVYMQAQSQCVGTFKLLWVQWEQQVLWLQSLKRHVYFPCWHIPRTGLAENACLSLSLRPCGPALTWRCPHLAQNRQGGSVPATSLLLSVPGLARSTPSRQLSAHVFMPKGSLLGWLRVGRADPGHVVRRGSTLLVRVRCGAAADVRVTSERQGPVWLCRWRDWQG